MGICTTNRAAISAVHLVMTGVAIGAAAGAEGTSGEEAEETSVGEAEATSEAVAGRCFIRLSVRLYKVLLDSSMTVEACKYKTKFAKMKGYLLKH